MVFVSPIFIFIFLPLTLACYALAEFSRRKWIKNTVLLFFFPGFLFLGGLNLPSSADVLYRGQLRLRTAPGK